MKKIYLFLIVVIVFLLHQVQSILNNKFERVYFNFVHGNSSKIYTRFYMNELSDLIKHEKFNFNRKTVFYIHGWIDDYDSEGTQLVTESYIKRNDHNIVIVDWGQYSVTELILTVLQCTRIANILGVKLLELFDHGLKPKLVHCVGHSFGSHMCGIIGRRIQKDSRRKYKLDRITALDPPWPGFYPAVSDSPLTKYDAEFVDAIHTDSFFVGHFGKVGHVDFYPNNAQVQPGCPKLRTLDIANNYCSHFHSWRYWSKSLNPTERYVFPSRKCGNWDDFVAGNCDTNNINFMGYNASPKYPGVYFIKLSTTKDFTATKEFYHYVTTSLINRFDLIDLRKNFISKRN